MASQKGKRSVFRSRPPQILSLPAEALELLKQAAEVAETAGDALGLADALASMGRVHMQSGDPAAAKTCYAGALEIGTETGDPRIRASAFNGLGWACWAHDDLAQARAMFVEARNVAKQDADMLDYCEALVFLADLERSSGSFERAGDLLDEALPLARSIHSKFHQARALSAMGRLEQEVKNLEVAAQAYEQAVDSAWSGGIWFVHVRALLSLAEVWTMLGDSSKPKALLGQAIQVARKVHDREGLANALFALGRHLRAQGDDPGAMAHHQMALGLRAELSRHDGLTDSLQAVAALLAESRPETAARIMGAVTSIRQADVKGADSGFACPCCAGDAHTVVQTVKAQALEWAVVEGAGLTGADAAAYALRGRGKRSGEKVGFGALTPTERRVAELAVEGLSNPAIGEKLFIARRTVDTHLVHIYQKLGVSSKIHLMKVFPALAGPPD